MPAMSLPWADGWRLPLPHPPSPPPPPPFPFLSYRTPPLFSPLNTSPPVPVSLTLTHALTLSLTSRPVASIQSL